MLCRSAAFDGREDRPDADGCVRGDRERRVVRVSDPIVLEWTPLNACRRRLTFEPREIGGWDRTEEERRDEEWHVVDHEVVTHVELDRSGPDGPSGVTTYRGP